MIYLGAMMETKMSFTSRDWCSDTTGMGELGEDFIIKSGRNRSFCHGNQEWDKQSLINIPHRTFHYKVIEWLRESFNIRSLVQIDPILVANKTATISQLFNGPGLKLVEWISLQFHAGRGLHH